MGKQQLARKDEEIMEGLTEVSSFATEWRMAEQNHHERLRITEESHKEQLRIAEQSHREQLRMAEQSHKEQLIMAEKSHMELHESRTTSAVQAEPGIVAEEQELQLFELQEEIGKHQKHNSQLQQEPRRFDPRSPLLSPVQDAPAHVVSRGSLLSVPENRSLKQDKMD